jgi:large subunit ribosomal protein L23
MSLFSKKTKNDDEKGSNAVVKKDVTEKKVAKVNDGEKTSMKDLYSGVPTKKGDQAGEISISKKLSSNAYKVLCKPIITEKITNLAALNKYAFRINFNSNKIEVAKAFEDIYGVKPKSVNIIKVLGKKVRYGRISGVRKNSKKAIITLPEGKTIKVYEGV